MKTFGFKDNYCIALGLQGVEQQIVYTAEEGQSVAFAMNSPQNNVRYVITNYTSVLFGMLETPPEPYFNFQVTFKNINGFYGTIVGNFRMTDDDIAESGNTIKVYWDNPDFDITDNYTVLHIHIWHDGINYCGHIDGYVEET